MPKDKSIYRFFVQLKSYGICDERSRTVMGVECSLKKLVAPPDKPLELLSRMMNTFIDSMRYSSDEAARADLEAFKAEVSNLELTNEQD